MKKLISIFAVLALATTSATTSTAWIQHNQQFKATDSQVSNETAQDIANKLKNKTINLKLDFWYHKNLIYDPNHFRQDIVDSNVLTYEEAQFVIPGNLYISKAGDLKDCSFEVTKDKQTVTANNITLHVIAGESAADIAKKLQDKDILISPQVWGRKDPEYQIPLLRKTIVENGLLKADEAQYIESANEAEVFNPLKTVTYINGHITFSKYGQKATANIQYEQQNLLDFNNFEGENALNWHYIGGGVNFGLEFDWQTLASHIFNFNNVAELFDLLFLQPTIYNYNIYAWTPVSSWSSLLRNTVLSAFKIAFRNYLQTQIQNIYQQARSAYAGGVGFMLNFNYFTSTHKINDFSALKLKRATMPKEGLNKVEGDNKFPGEQMSVYLNDQYSQLIDDFYTKSGNDLYNWLTGKGQPPQSFPQANQFDIAANSGQTYAGYNVWNQNSLSAIKKALNNTYFLNLIKQEAHANSFKRGIKITFLRYKDKERCWVAPQGSGNNSFDNSKFEGILDKESKEYKTQFILSSDQLLKLSHYNGATNFFDSPDNAGKFYDWLTQQWQMKDKFNAFLNTLSSDHKTLIQNIITGKATILPGGYSWNNFRQDALQGIENKVGVALEIDFQQNTSKTEHYHTWVRDEL